MKKKWSVYPLSILFLLFSNTLTLAATNGGIGLKANTQSDIAVDPEKNEEIDSDKDPTEGPYSISYVSDFKFGTHKIPKDVATYYADNDIVKIKESKEKREVQNFIQVSDSSGSTSGWKLFVSSPVALESGKNKVEGATYKFANVNVRPINSDHNEFQKTYNINTVKGPNKVVSGSNQNTLIAESKGIEGQGRWHVLFGNNLNEGKQSVSITIPKGVIKEKGIYSSSLSWEFINAK